MVQQLVHPKYPKVSATWEEISPSVASEYLDKNDQNRPFDSRNISKIVSDLASDAFDDQNPAPIVFDEHGVLSNGQHRLTGIVQTGKTVTMLVVRGVRPEVYLTMDSGKSRTFSEALQRKKYKNYSALSSIVRGCLVYGRSGSLKNIDRPVSNSAAMTALKRQEKRFVGLAAWARAVTDSKKITRIPMSPKRAGVLRYALEDAGASKEDLEAFFGSLSGHQNAPQPILMLRSKLQQIKEKGGTKKSKVTAEYVFAISIKAWNAYLEGREVKRLDWRAGGARPEPFPAILPSPSSD